MYRTYIICIGSELLSGATLERHGHYLAGRLREYNVGVTGIRIVPDDTQRIVSAIGETPGNSLVVLTGGLGPTQDDLTRAAIAEAAGVSLEFDDRVWADIQSRSGRRLSGSNRRQAYIPSGFSALENEWGTAPGLLGRISSVTVAALPGPPRELHGMVVRHLDTILNAAWVSISAATDTLIFTCFGVPESELEDALGAAAEHHELAERLTWSTRAEVMRIVVTLIGGSDSDRRAVFDAVEAEYGLDRMVQGETSIGAVVVDELAARGLVLAAAESCTGGLVGSAITDIAGSSQVFWGSMVTYANDAKKSILGVDDSIVEQKGAVSEECVRAMVGGLTDRSPASILVAISGVAGPTGGTPDKPVGTVWIACATRGSAPVAVRLNVPGNRDRVRRFATLEALLIVRKMIRATP